MSRYLSTWYTGLKPYVPGEQPQDRRYVKLNTNESPFPPGPAALRYAAEHVRSFELYSDPEATALRDALAERYGVARDSVIVSNGSDEMLHFAFLAFGGEDRPALFPDITYGFYRVFADIVRMPYREIPLEEDLSLSLEPYMGQRALIFLANPNAPTGLALAPEQIAELARKSPDSVIVVDEAYVDFGAESCVPLTRELDNLLVVQTFSKSRSMAGARLGFGIGQTQLIRDLQTIRYSLNPYNVNSYTQALGIGMLRDEETVRANCRYLADGRTELLRALRELGFDCTDSLANFVFVRHPRVGGAELYRQLKERGILVRHFELPRIREYNRITVGTREQTDCLLNAIRAILQA